ncbi:MAG: hypothetical protein V4858_16425 [Pseudomonadota bacterium]
MTMNKYLSKLLAAGVVTAASVVLAPAALAHGTPAPLHGGVVQMAAHMTFELVATPDGAVVYALDHDKELDVSRFNGKLTVLNGSEKSEAPLIPAGGNKLEAKGVKLSPGAKVVAVLNSDNKKPLTVRFVVKK